VSVGWDRYAFDAFALACLGIGGALVGLVRYAGQTLRSTQPARRAKAAAALGPVVCVALVVGVQLGQRVNDLASPADTSVFAFADYLNRNVETTAVIETWEWQLAPLSARTFHFPENAWVDRYTALISGGQALEHTYDIWSASPAFLIDGPFSRWTGIYRAALRDACCTLVVRIGPYNLYSVDRRHGSPERDRQ
jgi:hypothetical protein